MSLPLPRRTPRARCRRASPPLCSALSLSQQTWSSCGLGGSRGAGGPRMALQGKGPWAAGRAAWCSIVAAAAGASAGKAQGAVDQRVEYSGQRRPSAAPAPGSAAIEYPRTVVGRELPAVRHRGGGHRALQAAAVAGGGQGGQGAQGPWLARAATTGLQGGQAGRQAGTQARSPKVAQLEPRRLLAVQQRVLQLYIAVTHVLRGAKGSVNLL